MREKTRLEKWLSKKCEEGLLPPLKAGTYFDRYWQVATYLEGEVHPHITAGALVRGDGFLTDHGVDHILTIHERVLELIDSPEGMLSAYEIYLLLMAIQFHDVGNIFGRKEHAQKSELVMARIRELMAGDAPEKRTISQIAQAHTGVGGEQDTISILPRKEPVLSKDVRYQALAALLRLADELAEDTRRAARFPLDTGMIPEQSEIFHRYANHLHSVRAYSDTQTIDLRFEMNVDVAIEKYGKGDDKVFLLDEIFDRVMKIHRERAYCMRFLVPLLYYGSVKVTIRIFHSDEHPRPLEEIGFTLKEKGYPKDGHSLQDICPDVEWTGAELRDYLLGELKIDENIA